MAKAASLQGVKKSEFARKHELADLLLLIKSGKVIGLRGNDALTGAHRIAIIAAHTAVRIAFKARLQIFFRTKKFEYIGRTDDNTELAAIALVEIDSDPAIK